MHAGLAQSFLAVCGWADQVCFVRALQFQRRRFAEYWARKWVPSWLGMQLSRVGPILFSWRNRPAIKEAFKVRPLPSE